VNTAGKVSDDLILISLGPDCDCKILTGINRTIYLFKRKVMKVLRDYTDIRALSIGDLWIIQVISRNSVGTATV